MKNILLNKNIEPRCQYCANGTRSRDGSMVLCIKKGIVTLNYKCRKFKYDPLQREPETMPDLPKFSKDDFKL